MPLPKVGIDANESAVLSSNMTIANGKPTPTRRQQIADRINNGEPLTPSEQLVAAILGLATTPDEGDAPAYKYRRPH